MPRCSPCELADVDCVVTGPSGSGNYNRQYVASLQAKVCALEQRENELKALVRREKLRLGKTPSGSVANPEVTAVTRKVKNSPSTATANTAISEHGMHGMGFIGLIFAKIKSEVINSRGLSNWQKHSDQPSPSNSTSASLLISPDVIQSLFETYIRRAHSRYPFMELATIISLREKTLTAARSAGVIRLTAEESFRAYSIMATGTVYRNQESFVRGTSEDVDSLVSPAELFSVAMRSARQVNMLYGIQGVQNLLLVSRFCLFQDVGMSLWDLSSLNIRTCIECGFHRQPTAPLPAIEEQMRRRVFWQCYGLERYASTTLGRPFTIPDEAITVKLPANVDDSVLQEAATLLPNASLDELTEAQPPPKGLTDTSVVIPHIQLRQITSRMSRDYRILRNQLATSQDPPGSLRNSAVDLDMFTLNGKVWNTYYQYSQELHNWRLYSGMDTHKDIAPDSNGQIFLHDSRWIDLHFHQEKLFLIRLSIEPSSATDSHFINPGDLLEELYDAASNVILLYSEIADDAKIEPTAGRLYRVLTAGLSILYTIVIESQTGQAKDKRPDGPSRPRPSRQTISGKKSLLRKCTDTLDRMAKQMTNQHLTPRYVAYFELLCRETLRILPKSTVQESTTSDASNQQAIQHSLPQTHTSATSAPAVSSAFAPLQDVSPDYFGSSLLSAPLTCHLPTEHGQPCYCAVIGSQLDDSSGAASWPDFLASGIGVDGISETYDPAAMFGSEWGEATEIWEALFGNGQLGAMEGSSFY
ncbi:unnamed protein product [Clonostachys rosea]|uniref:Xylanolytic transcriptional activator regulatory domain-containing protein n=1 Tax=Bionectria ochroleuca TaxID=29856 RepID=A0ABY6TV28_BIOOC|nr:unnamed protein product [Clonostachys rosea]